MIITSQTETNLTSSPQLYSTYEIPHSFIHTVEYLNKTTTSVLVFCATHGVILSMLGEPINFQHKQSETHEISSETSSRDKQKRVFRGHDLLLHSPYLHHWFSTVITLLSDMRKPERWTHSKSVNGSIQVNSMEIWKITFTVYLLITMQCSVFLSFSSENFLRFLNQDTFTW